MLRPGTCGIRWKADPIYKWYVRALQDLWACLELHQAHSQPASLAAVSCCSGNWVSRASAHTCWVWECSLTSLQLLKRITNAQQKKSRYKLYKRVQLRLFARVCLRDGWGKEGRGGESEKFCKATTFARTRKLDWRVLLHLWRVGCLFSALFLTAWVWILGCVLMMPCERRGACLWECFGSFGWAEC